MEKRNDSINQYRNITGATTNTPTINPVVSADAASDYNVVLTECSVPFDPIMLLLVVNDAVVNNSQ
jgi:hypothetical protein